MTDRQQGTQETSDKFVTTGKFTKPPRRTPGKLVDLISGKVLAEGFEEQDGSFTISAPGEPVFETPDEAAEIANPIGYAKDPSK